MDQNAVESNTPKVIAGIYELKERIGSGGAGIVYLGRHLRLNKAVVLKADKRTLSAKENALRREVDALKNLSHTYIPQVYDFVVESDTVYTVMDYIEGESLDKPLKRGERFSQVQVIEWACELLDALCYLHGVPPHGILHSDIKPSNIMLTPQGTIRLIDFNIALALGEEGAVRVGGSMGYASPEHYGVSFSKRFTDTSPAASGQSMSGASAPSTSSGGKSVLLDVRSDIYSLGATLYHLLTGVKPDANAKNVLPIALPEISPSVAAIIRTAMDPDPDQRYQTAAEMLEAFQRLHTEDPRAKRHKRNTAIAASVLLSTFLIGGVCSLVGMQRLSYQAELDKQAAEVDKQNAILAQETEQREKQALSDVTASEEAFRAGNNTDAVSYALSAVTVESPYTNRAQKALTDALGVYDLGKGFKAHCLITLPSEPQKVCLSPDGTYVAAMTGKTMSVYNTESGIERITLQKDASALSDVVFLDKNIVLFAGDGALQAYDLSSQTELWSGAPATSISVSADGSTVAAVYRDVQYATIYNAATGEVIQEVDFQGLKQRVLPNDILSDEGHNLFALNRDGTHLAVSFSNGALWVFNLQNSEMDAEIFDVSNYVHFEGGFCGSFFAFSTRNSAGDDSIFAVIDMERLEQTVSYQNTVPFHVQAGEDGIYVSTGHTLVGIDTTSWTDYEAAYSEGPSIASFYKGRAYTLTVLQNGSYAFYDSTASLVGSDMPASPVSFAQIAGDYAVVAGTDDPSLRVMKLEKHIQEQIFTYDRQIVHDEARLSADGQTVMLFRFDGFHLFSIDGTLTAQTEFPEPGNVYDTLYRRDGSGSYLEVIYNNGLTRSYSAADGSLLSERLDPLPDRSMEEEFLTEKFRILSPLHGTPQVYSRDSGELVCELEADAYLTYVTEVNGYIIAEYITAERERYGLLLNGDCETLAKLPDLCDITKDGVLIFDDMRGTLRESRIYTVEELISMAEAEVKDT